jgi:hypothetical protein
MHHVGHRTFELQIKGTMYTRPQTCIIRRRMMQVASGFASSRAFEVLQIERTMWDIAR